MKLLINTFVVSLFILLNACSFNENTKISTFKVWGNCDMCKETIETSLKQKGIVFSSWNTETKMITIEHDTTKIKEDNLHKLISGVGYDTEKEKGNDLAYQNLHECCQYKRRDQK